MEAGMRFRATVEPAGNATGVEVPAQVVEALGSGKRPKVAITINNPTWRSRVASMRGPAVSSPIMAMW
jgi:antitoxin component of MazEF toxin-antitoxin module